MTTALDLETSELPTALLRICSKKATPGQNETLHAVEPFKYYGFWSVL